MNKRINTDDWLNNIFREQDMPPMGGQPDMGMGGPPMTQPGGPEDPMNQQPPTHMAIDQQPGEPEDISDDPQYPEMPEEKEQDDFEIWKIKFVEDSIKGDPQQLINKILQIRDRELDPPQRKFVEDNFDINMLRQNSNIFQASNEIRKRIKKDFDRTNPATSVIQHISDVLSENPMLNEVFIKISGLGGGKMDQHRKFIGSLMGCVQVGSGGQNEDLVFEEADYSIRISTRFNSRWGDVNIGRWYLKEDDPERFLKEAELDRLEGGSPEEKDVLRRRVVIESIADHYMERAFIINVVSPDGMVQHLGWDLGNCLKGAFLDGKLVVRTSDNDNKEAFIDEQGSIIAVPNMSIYYIKETGEISNSGKTEIEEVEFIQHRDGMLYLSAPISLIKEAAVSLRGITFKETMWSGNPSDLLRLQRCVPSSSEMILRIC
jgi:hypothetical protein